MHRSPVVGAKKSIALYLLKENPQSFSLKDLRDYGVQGENLSRRLRELRDLGWEYTSTSDGMYSITKVGAHPDSDEWVSRRQHISARVRRLVLDRDGRCMVCGATALTRELTIGHIVPVSSGGSNSVGNLRCECIICNEPVKDTDTSLENQYRNVVNKLRDSGLSEQSLLELKEYELLAEFFSLAQST